MKEKAMLIAAAKAAGIYEKLDFDANTICGVWKPKYRTLRAPYWNPLQDNDDAMRLYAEMEFTIEYNGDLVSVRDYEGVDVYSFGTRVPDGESDRCAVLRYVITLAAANRWLRNGQPVE